MSRLGSKRTTIPNEQVTTKLQVALQSAQQLALRPAHPELRSNHQLIALLQQQGGIVQLQLERVKARLKQQGLILNLSEEAVEFIGNQGYDSIYGARPLKRAIQSRLLDPMSLALLDGRFASGKEITAFVTELHQVIPAGPLHLGWGPASFLLWFVWSRRPRQRGGSRFLRIPSH